MVPDTAGRLRTAVEDLELLVEDSPSGESSTPEFKSAVVALAEANKALRGAE